MCRLVFHHLFPGVAGECIAPISAPAVWPPIYHWGCCVPCLACRNGAALGQRSRMSDTAQSFTCRGTPPSTCATYDMAAALSTLRLQLLAEQRASSPVRWQLPLGLLSPAAPASLQARAGSLATIPNPSVVAALDSDLHMPHLALAQGQTVPLLRRLCATHARSWCRVQQRCSVRELNSAWRRESQLGQAGRAHLYHRKRRRSAFVSASPTAATPPHDPAHFCPRCAQWSSCSAVSNYWEERMLEWKCESWARA